jgi:hypothetical protein
LFEHLKQFESITKRLYRDDISMDDMRLMFDALNAEYPVMTEHLKATTKIVQTPVRLSKPSRVARFRLWLQHRRERSKEREGDTSLRHQGKTKKERQHDPTRHYAPLLKIIPPTPNKVERLFSQCKLVLTPQRRSVNPANFEQLAFLRANREMWDVTTVVSVRRRKVCRKFYTPCQVTQQ